MHTTPIESSMWCTLKPILKNHKNHKDTLAVLKLAEVGKLDMQPGVDKGMVGRGMVGRGMLLEVGVGTQPEGMRAGVVVGR